MTEIAVFTIGHSNRTLSEFIDLLGSADIRTLVDIRRFPTSRRHPQFSAPTLRSDLAAGGIDYLHLPDLGGYRADAEARPAGPNDGWPPGSLRNYADYATTAGFQAAFERFRQGLRPHTVLMCAEKRWADCHRQIVADYLIARGHAVVHVVDAQTRERGRLTPFARVSAGGVIHYPAAHAQLTLDF